MNNKQSEDEKQIIHNPIFFSAITISIVGLFYVWTIFYVQNKEIKLKAEQQKQTESIAKQADLQKKAIAQQLKDCLSEIDERQSKIFNDTKNKTISLEEIKFLTGYIEQKKEGCYKQYPSIP